VHDTIDFSALSDDEIRNIERIDMVDGRAREIDGLTLDDVIEMTDGENVLVIDGDEADRVGVPEAPQNYTVEKTVENGYDVYTYSSTDGDPTVTLKIDQDIQHG
jgi:hypothetical protein